MRAPCFLGFPWLRASLATTDLWEPEAWLKDSAWREVCSLAFRYLDVDQDGLLSAQARGKRTCAKRHQNLPKEGAPKKWKPTSSPQKRAPTTVPHKNLDGIFLVRVSSCVGAMLLENIDPINTLKTSGYVIIGSLLLVWEDTGREPEFLAKRAPPNSTMSFLVSK